MHFDNRITMTPRLESGDLAIVPVETPTAEASVCFTWRGRCAPRSPSELLAPFFEDVLSQAEARGVRVEMRFDELTHFNSSTITALLSFIEDARQRQVPLTLVYDANTKWQRMNFGAMRVLSKGDGLLELRGQ